MKAKGSRSVGHSFFNLGSRRGWVVKVTLEAALPPAKTHGSHIQEAGWTPDLIWTGAENINPIRIRSPDRPVHKVTMEQGFLNIISPSHGRCSASLWA